MNDRPSCPACKQPLRVGNRIEPGTGASTIIVYCNNVSRCPNDNTAARKTYEGKTQKDAVNQLVKAYAQ